MNEVEINHYKRYLVFLGVALMAIIINVDLTAVNLALASIGMQFHASLTTLQWVINIYILFGTALLVLCGRLGDIYGKKKIYLFGVGLFLLASIICGFSVNSTMLIVGRGIQGIAFGFTLTLGILIATSAFPKEKRGTVLGSYAMIAGFSQALGPSLGGVFLQYLSWRWLFFINIPLGIGCIILISLYYLQTESTNYGESLDTTGAVLLSCGLILFTLAINEISRWGIWSFGFLTCFFVSIIILGIFYLFEKNRTHPLIDFSLYKNRNYFFISIIRFLNTYVAFTVIFILPLFLQNILELSPIKTGLMLLTMTAMYGALSPFVGKLLDRVAYKYPLVFSLIISLIACILVANLQFMMSWWFLLAAFILFGISRAFIFLSP